MSFTTWRLTSLEKGELRYLIREFLELHRLLEKAKGLEVQAEAKNLLKKLEKGMAVEERIEYKQAKNFDRLRKAIIKARSSFSLQEDAEISRLFQQASYSDGVLKRIAARGGEIKKALENVAEKQSSQNLQDLRKLLQEAITADRAFVEIMEELFALAKSHKVLRSELTIQNALPHLALSVYQNVLILFDYTAYSHIYQEELKNLSKLYGQYAEQQVGKWRRNRLRRKSDAYYQQITAKAPPDSSMGLWSEEAPKLREVEDKLMKKSIVGYAELKGNFEDDQFLNAWEIYRIAAKKGYGVFLTELVLCYAAEFHKAVVIDRNSVSKAAQKAWSSLDLNRRDVLKFPSALRKYHSLLGYSEKDIYDKFGESGLRSVTFNRFGYPRGCSKERMEVFLTSLRERWRKDPSELKLSWMDRMKVTDEFGGGWASLDKAYYYDGKKNILKELLARGNRVGYYPGKDKISRSRLLSNIGILYHAGYAFFQSFNEEAHK